MLVLDKLQRLYGSNISIILSSISGGSSCIVAMRMHEVFALSCKFCMPGKSEAAREHDSGRGLKFKFKLAVLHIECDYKAVQSTGIR